MPAVPKIVKQSYIEWGSALWGLMHGCCMHHFSPVSHQKQAWLGKQLIALINDHMTVTGSSLLVVLAPQQRLLDPQMDLGGLADGRDIAGALVACLKQTIWLH